MIRRGKYNFGFIALGTGPSALEDEKLPRVYFNPSHLGDTSLYLRRGYEVEFTVALDEENRTVAHDIVLTEAGHRIKAEKDAAAAIKRAEREAEEAAHPPAAADAAGAAARRRRPRRERAPGRVLKLTVKVEGKSVTGSIDFQTSDSIGRLKAMAVAAVSADPECSVYALTADSGPKGVFLTKALLSKMNDGDAVLLGPKREEATSA